MRTLIPYPGGKAKLAKIIAYSLDAYTPRNGIYYEGFAGTAAVAVELGHRRPDIHKILTDTSGPLIRTLQEIRDRNPNGLATMVLNNIRILMGIREKEERDAILRIWANKPQYADQYLAAMQCRYPGELFSFHWNPDDKRLASRISNLSANLEYWHIGLQNTSIAHWRALKSPCDAAYFDFPYYGAKKCYPSQEGTQEDYAQLAKDQMECTRNYIVLSNFDTAAHLYPDFRQVILGRELSAWRSKAKDCLYEWMPPGKEIPVVTTMRDSMLKS